MSQTPLYANVLLAARVYVSSAARDSSNGIHTAVNCRLRSETENGPEKTGAFIANPPIDPDKVSRQAFVY